MTELDELRKEIEEITIQMLSNLKTRTDIAEKIGRIKSEQGMSVSNESREDDLRELVKSQCKKIDFDEAQILYIKILLMNAKKEGT